MQQAASSVIVVGGGPAGLMAGLLLARAGVRVTVLEKHGDFFRDFRGDTVHPSTMEVLSELGLLDQFLKRPHNRVETAEIDWNGRLMQVGDLTHLHMPAPFIAMMPQWDFLDFLREVAAAMPNFALRMEATVSSYLHEQGRVCGVVLASGEEMRGDLTIAADGRGSFVRRVLPLENLGAPIDVMWLALPKGQRGTALRGIVRKGRLIVLIDRGDYWQCAYVIGKGQADAVKARGIAALRAELQAVAPDLPDLSSALPDFGKVALLSVSLDRLKRWWQPGLLAIGDAAHAMSPVGGIGINLAFQDAVCTANILARPLAEGQPVDRLLERVERRRLLPTRIIQNGQRSIHQNVLAPVLAGSLDDGGAPPLALRVLNRFARLRRIPGWLIGHGIRQEHVRSPDAFGNSIRPRLSF